MSNVDPTRVIGSTGMPVSDRTMVAPGGVGATQQIPTGGDPYKTRMGGVTVCPICKSSTPQPEIYCGDCGFLLTATPAEAVELPEETAAPAELVDPADGRRYPLHTGVNTVGRQGTDVLVNEGTVSRVHARIVVENNAVTVEDLGSSNGTKVGDRRIGPNQPTPAGNGTPLRFGNWKITLEIANGGPVVAAEPASAPPVAEPAPSALPEATADGPVVAILQKQEGPSGDIALRIGKVTVGRRTGNTFAFPQDSYVSGRHAEFITDNTGTYLTDVGSTNGTVVNGQRLEPNDRTLLLEGDEVQIGQTKYLFTLADLDEDEIAEETEAVPATEGDFNIPDEEPDPSSMD